MPLAKNVLAPLGLTADMSAIDGSIPKKIHGSGVKLIIEQEDDTLPLEDIVSICSITIIIKSVYRDYCDRFYPQIHLENCIYKKC